MLKGGYQIIDFEDKNHELGAGVVHEGIYYKIEGTRKAILMSGLVLEGSELNDCFSSVSVVGSSFVLCVPAITTDSVRWFKVTIEDTDVVTVSIAE